MDNKTHKIVIVGGGISGLTTAFYLEKYLGLNHDKRKQYSITLVEKSPNMGGKISTNYVQDCVIERGPDSFLARKWPMLDLLQELNLISELVGTNPNAKKVYIAQTQKLLPFPKGLQLAIPSDTKSILNTTLLTHLEKARVLADLFLPFDGGDIEDESLGTLLANRFGRAFVDKICEPILAGIYAGDIDQLSVQATFPQFQKLLLEHASLIRAAKRQVSAAKVQQHPSLPLHLQNSMFLSLRNGFSQLIESITNALKKTTLLTNAHVRIIENKDNQGVSSSYILKLADQRTLEADTIILTTPTHCYRQWFPQYLNDQDIQLPRHVSVANVVYIFQASEWSKKLDGTGFLVPRSLEKLTTACTWTSVKWPHIADEQLFVLRAYVGRANQQSWQQYDNSNLATIVYHELKEWMPHLSTPVYSEVNRWYEAMPQYEVGHLQKIERLRAHLQSKCPNVHLTGADFEGVGLPDVVQKAQLLAESLIEKWDAI
jgi:oxygen-dependent protoporphyrinogen oxidase